MIEIIGQSLGILAAVFGFLSYQMKSQKGILLFQTLTSISMTVHYLMIGAYSGMALNLVCAVRNGVFWLESRKGGVNRWLAIGFTVVMGAAGIFSWQNWYSIFVCLGLVINSFCMSFKDPQNIRKSILVSSPLVIIYNVFARSYGGIVFELIVLVSTLIGLICHRKEKTDG